jgi:hypothetical protein
MVRDNTRTGMRLRAFVGLGLHPRMCAATERRQLLRPSPANPGFDRNGCHPQTPGSAATAITRG